MNTVASVTSYKQLRELPLWSLLAAKHAPIILGLLQNHLYEQEKTLPSSILHERIAQDLELLRAHGEDLPQTAQAYIAHWLSEGYLERHFPTGSKEEEYELSVAAVDAIRFVSQLTKPHTATTESRLSIVIDFLTQLAEDTDSDKNRRLQKLMEEKARIESEIEALHNGNVTTITEERALERTQEIMVLAESLTGDFHRVRDRFDKIHRQLRENIMDTEGKRSDVLAAIFSDMDVIAESDAGRTFNAFWRLLNNPDQSAKLDSALDHILSQTFTQALSGKERLFLRRFPRLLLEQADKVHDVLQTFARSLKHFVQSREYQEQQRIIQLLKTAQKYALANKNTCKVEQSIDYQLMLTSSNIQSIAQLKLHNPEDQAPVESMRIGENTDLDLATVSALISQSEIDFKSLKQHIGTLLHHHEQVSINTVLTTYPAQQGLGSIVGLISLGCQYGERTSEKEIVSWQDSDNIVRSAHIPKIYFTQERLHELEAQH